MNWANATAENFSHLCLGKHKNLTSFFFYFSTQRCRWSLKCFFMEDRNMFMRHGYWWPGSLRVQGISSHGSELVLQEYSNLGTRRLINFQVSDIQWIFAYRLRRPYQTLEMKIHNALVWEPALFQVSWRPFPDVRRGSCDLWWESAEPLILPEVTGHAEIQYTLVEYNGLNYASTPVWRSKVNYWLIRQNSLGQHSLTRYLTTAQLLT